jgi:RNA polymerase sigma-70 factor (ECF subfamily)
LLTSRALSVAEADVLFAEHRQSVFRYLCRFVGRAETAHDLTQEVFLRVARARTPEADAAGRRAWVFRIARNLALNHVRDSRHDAMAVDLGHTAAPAPAVQELGVAIREALAALPDLDRDVFLLRETAGLSYDEIAAACELTVEAVRSRLRRARQQLRGALAGPIGVHRHRPLRFGGPGLDRNE